MRQEGAYHVEVAMVVSPQTEPGPEETSQAEVRAFELLKKDAVVGEAGLSRSISSRVGLISLSSIA